MGVEGEREGGKDANRVHDSNPSEICFHGMWKVLSRGDAGGVSWPDGNRILPGAQQRFNDFPAAAHMGARPRAAGRVFDELSERARCAGRSGF